MGGNNEPKISQGVKRGTKNRDKMVYQEESNNEDWWVLYLLSRGGKELLDNKCWNIRIEEIVIWIGLGKGGII